MSVPRWAWPVAAVVAFAGAIALSGRDVKSPEGNELIRTPGEYQDANGKVRSYTQSAFVAEEKGDEVTPAMKEDLKKAIPLLHEMNRYAPVKVAAYFALGKTEMILGDLPEAGRALEQAILNESADLEEKESESLKATVIEAKCLLAEVLLDYSVQRLQSAAGKSPAEMDQAQKDAHTMQVRAANWAADAVKAQPQAPRYWAALASSYLALGKADQAKAAVGQAAALDKNHFKVRPLLSLLAAHP